MSDTKSIEPMRVSSSKAEVILNFLLSFGFFVVLILSLTNLIPLMQFGWMDPLSSKTRYVNTMRISVIVYSMVLLVGYLLRPEWVVRSWISTTFKKFVSFNPVVLLISGYLFYSVSVVLVVLNRHAALETRAFDLGIFAQAIWNTLQGDFLYSSIKEGINLMGDHVSPILLLTAPAYFIWSDPRSLLVLQVLISAMCIFPIYIIARDRLGDAKLALIFPLLYLFYLPSRNALHEDFHPEVLVEPVILLAFWLLEHNRIKLFLAALVLIACGKENMLGLTFFFGAYAALFRSKSILGIVIMTVSVALFIFEVKWLVPYLSGKPYLYQGFYHHLQQAGFGEVIGELLSGDRFEYVLKVYSPFLFLSFFHLPTLLLTAPIMGQNLLSINPAMRSFAYHYTTGLAPFVFISAIYGFHLVLTRFSWVRQNKVVLIGALVAISMFRSGPSEYYYWWQSQMHRSEHRDQIREELSKIPSDKIVLTHNNFIPQLINRKFVYQFDYNARPTKAEDAVRRNADLVIFDRQFWEPKSLPLEDSLRDLERAGYIQTTSRNGFYILEKSNP